MGTYRMRFLWPDEIDADRAHYQKLLEKWGSDEAIDDMEHAFGSLFWQMPERVPCVTLGAKTGLEALEEAAMRWQRHPRLDGRVGRYLFISSHAVYLRTGVGPDSTEDTPRRPDAYQVV